MPEAPPPRIYLDHNATAPLLPVAFERMAAALRELPGNPSSPHAFGQAARAALEAERARLADLLGVSRRELIFTSGGSEANALVLRAVAEEGLPAHVIVSAVEHPSVLRGADWLARHGVAVSHLPVTERGEVQIAALGELIRPETRLVSVMAANNETGVIQPIARVVEEVRRRQGDRPIRVHTDAVQAFGRIPLPLATWGVDGATLAAHKLGGPKGIGALALRLGWQPAPLVLGGKQERGLRAGTESAFLVAGFAAAAGWLHAHAAEIWGRVAALRDRLAEQLGDLEGFFLNGAGAPRLPNTANLGFDGLSAESLLVALDLEGIAVSAGSACSSGAIEPSHVLLAMGLPEPRVRASLRISLGPATQAAEIDRCSEVLRAQVRRLRAGRR
ncbi:MAG: cysteine desulfurase [Candidatus Lambdaproteobacteria bacterium]|nr:cysteine desulfurase [Candidatus Lambdaproteobacteria bacterium]